MIRFVALAALTASGCCTRPANITPSTLPGTEGTRLRIVVQADGYMSVLQHEFLADQFSCVWVSVPGNNYAAGFTERDSPETLYVFEALQGDGSKLPGWGPISSGTFLQSSDLQQYKVIKCVAPVRFLRLPDGNLAPGFFDPGHGVFFRWRNEVRSAAGEYYDFDPSSSAMSPMVHPKRVKKALDITPPEDAELRSPSNPPG